ncbi:cytochrome ubiquinol oxidase subunit I [Pseudodesulfovibrio sp.]|uniref:cytochrome ubiquinol oxidase subunit I n=1 Tax=Pseudodesulfovibrio sp. TaxID=2035812 RepID=UPI00261DC612|nr:cytochrome ubiquinol oxidase subunit I [Pseudodesulfovibrio sp.]MDD3311670.1 cytochrome ubiquinol oxidase subunit I [Pseudodesulfovibrio sp.]
MQYPIWELTTLGGGFFIALIAVFHVFVAHFAVGGGFFLPVFESMAYKRESPALLDYVKKHTKFFLLVTMVFGGMTGVGIWFTISVLAPAATSTLIHTFVFGWAAEWVCFLAEIVALLLYHYRFDKMRRRDHLVVGWLYCVFAWLSLLLINGIIGFMLTPGGWLEGGGFWAGFFNPSFWPSLFFRTSMAAMIAGLFGFITAHRIPDAEAREAVYRACVRWTVIPVLLAVGFGWWYTAALPPEALERLAVKAARITRFYRLAPVFAAATFVAGAVLLVRLPRGARVALSAVLLVFGFCFLGSFEFLREAARKPYLIHGFMYSTQVRTADVARFAETGVLPTARWVRHHEITDANRVEAGRELFQMQCSPCHSVGGPMNDILPLTEKYPVIGMDAKLSGMGKLQSMMPPFAGNLAERLALATYIVDGLHGGKPGNIPFAGRNLPVDIPSFDREKAEYVLLAWNNLGMHCISDAYAEWVLLPPANDLFAQLVRRGDKPAVVTSGVRITYFVEPGFENPSKVCDFWTHAKSLFGAQPPDNVGLAGNGLKGEMKYHEDHKWFEAALIPVKPYPETGGFNPYPLFTVQARDEKTGELLAETRTAAPTSTEMGCKNCHGGPWKVDNLAGISARTGRDVLMSHDRLSNTELAAAAQGGAPRLCQSCHPDPVLGAEGQPGLLNLPAAIHGFHANFLSGRGSEACAYCHPNRPDGPTRCLRGVHAQADIGCVRCHGYLEDHALSLLKHEDEAGKAGARRLMANLSPRLGESKEAINPRLPWMQEPDCATCHVAYGVKPDRKTSVAFNAWTRGGPGLYRFTGDKLGALACIACHNSPHANYPTVNKYGRNRDNIGPMQYQGNPRTIGADGNCGVCHLKEVTANAHHTGR